MIKIQFASKNEHAQTYAQITPSGKIDVTILNIII